MMKLFTNLSNSSALKILIAGNFANTFVETTIVDVDDPRFQKPRRLPVFETDTGDYIFSTNAASNLLFPSSPEYSVETNSWLEWEAVQLQPTLVRSIGTKFDSEQLSNLLNSLNSVLLKQTYLLQVNAPTVCDIVIWTTLFPIFTDNILSKTFSNKYSNINKWFLKLQDLIEFKGARSMFLIPEGVECLQSISLSSFYPNLNLQESLNLSPVHSAKITSGVPASPSTPDALTTSKEPISDAELKAVEESWKSSTPVTHSKKRSPVLPVSDRRNVLITSALPYVNNVPHLGNIIGCVLSADVFARYCRAKDWNTVFICGTDEYGTATETKALEEGLTPREICDKYYKTHKETYEWFNINFDHFGRTTTSEQTEIVQDLFKCAHKNGFTSTQEMEQLLCEKCDRFLADRFVEGICPRCSFEDARGDQCDGCGHLINATDLIKPKCKLCKTAPVIRQSNHFFLELPKLEGKVSNWLNSVCGGWSHNAQVITKSWLKDGLKPRCITRDLKWGISVPVPGFEKKVFYVWFDACIGYLSLTKCYTDKWKSWWESDDKKPVTYYQFMAKDNVPFHSIMFPATLLASGRKYNMVNHLVATEYLNYEDGKFSKSRGIGVFGTDAKETGIPSDVFRFYLLYIRPEGQDSSFSWVDLATKNNSELLNNLGNFINRALVFVEKFFDGVIPDMVMTSEDYTLLAYIRRELNEYMNSLDKAKLRDGIKYILAVSRHGNQYMQTTQPWVLFKGSEKDKIRAGTIVGLCSNISCLLSIMLKPYMPQTVDTITQQLNISPDLFVLSSEIPMYIKPGHKIGKPAPLFSKIEQTAVDDFKKRFAGKQQPQENTSANSKSKKKSKQQNAVLNTVPSNNACTAELEAAIAKQGDLVRGLKSSGVPKSEWQPQVNVLLDMKKQLAEMKASLPNADELQEKVTKQGDLVRQLKSSGVPKSEWQPQVTILLELKKQLASVQN